MSGLKGNSIRVRAFQHTPSEPLGYFEHIFSEEEIPFEYARLWDEDPVSTGDATHLVFLGGPMSVNDEERTTVAQRGERTNPEGSKEADSRTRPVPWRPADRIGTRGNVYRFLNETGWYPVHPTPDATGVFASFPDTFHVFQMHGETFHLPVGGRLQCRGDRVPHQGFRLGSALGLQFHLEMTEGLIRDWTKGERKFLKEKIGRDTERYLERSNCCAGVAREFLYGNFRNTQMQSKK